MCMCRMAIFNFKIHVFSKDLEFGIQCFGMQMLVLEIVDSCVLLLIGDSGDVQFLVDLLEMEIFGVWNSSVLLLVWSEGLMFVVQKRC